MAKTSLKKPEPIPKKDSSFLTKSAKFGTVAGLGIGTLGYLAYLKNENPQLFSKMILNLGSVGYDFVKGGSSAAANSILERMGVWKFLEESLGIHLPSYAKQPIVKAALKISNVSDVPPPVPNLPEFNLPKSLTESPANTVEPSTYSPLLIQIPEPDSSFSSALFSAMSVDTQSSSPITSSLFESFANLKASSPMDIEYPPFIKRGKKRNIPNDFRVRKSTDRKKPKFF